MNPFIKIHNCDKIPEGAFVHKTDSAGWCVSAYRHTEGSEEFRAAIRAANMSTCPYCGQRLDEENTSTGILMEDFSEIIPSTGARLTVEGTPEEIADTIAMIGGNIMDGIEIDDFDESEYNYEGKGNDCCECGCDSAKARINST